MKRIEKFRKLLEEEIALLEEELKTVGRVNPDNPSDWEPIPKDMDIDSADENELADKIENFEGNSGILKNLEASYNEAKSALKKMDEGKYGICEVCGNEIEEDRLKVSLSAKTCKKDSIMNIP